ncbi:MAG TPA: sigma-70 family RNA polymerase sigma factor [Candidatus Kapabacteria bacterium]|nr:sigma-70 family RNA polymerase sigma factor [Candidatus Kapabacteria bacterium]
MDQESQLVASCRRGDSDAWDQLFSTYYPVAGKFVFQLSPHLAREDVEEICQEVFVSVIRNIQAFQGHSAFQTWLYRIAANKTRDFIEKQRAAKRGGGEQPFSLDAEHPETGLKIDPPTQQAGPDRTLMNAEQMGLIHNALERLGDPCRELIQLKYFGDLSYDEIALELQLNPKTVSSRLSKCLDKLEEIARPMFTKEKFTPFPV